MRFRGCSTLLLLTLTLGMPASAQRISRGGSASSGTIRVDLSRERPGRESTRFLAVPGKPASQVGNTGSIPVARSNLLNSCQTQASKVSETSKTFRELSLYLTVSL